MSNKIVVVGSCNIDLVGYTSQMPKVGETIRGSKFLTNFGGKGANQVVAASRLGGNASMVARLGDDVMADKYLEVLKEAGVDTSFIMKTNGFSNGTALIIVNDNGENMIVIIGGANDALCLEDCTQAQSLIEDAAVVVCQLEVAQEVSIKAMEMCKGVSILNGAPGVANADSRLLTIPTIFCVNETEASLFSGLPVGNMEEGIMAMKDLLQKGCNSVLLTLGKEGAVYASRENPKPVCIPSPAVTSVDTTGAGDCFIGALAYLLANNTRNLSMVEMIKAANYVASDSVTKPGTQISYSGPEIWDRYFTLQQELPPSETPTSEKPTDDAKPPAGESMTSPTDTPDKSNKKCASRAEQMDDCHASPS